MTLRPAQLQRWAKSRKAVGNLVCVAATTAAVVAVLGALVAQHFPFAPKIVLITVILIQKHVRTILK
jgi:hypothetical protein